MNAGRTAATLSPGATPQRLMRGSPAPTLERKERAPTHSYTEFT